MSDDSGTDGASPFKLQVCHTLGGAILNDSCRLCSTATSPFYISQCNLLRVLAPPPLAGRVAAAVVLLEPVVEVAEAGQVDAVAKKPAEAEPRATGRGGGGVAGAAAARRPRLNRPDPSNICLYGATSGSGSLNALRP